MKLSNRLCVEAGRRDFVAEGADAAPLAHPAEHVVQFYESDDHLVRCIAGFFNERLSQDAAVIILATPEHREGVERHLQQQGHNIALLRQAERYTAIDAQERLDDLMRGDHVDEQRFVETVGDLISQVSKGASNVAIFGELVALLLRENQPKQAIRLEQLWNDLARHHRFSLLCAYPIKGFANDSHADSFVHICREHSRVIPVENYNQHDTESRRVDSIVEIQRNNASYQVKLDELRGLEKTMAAEIAELETFCHTLTHDMRSPLRAIQNAASNLLHDHAVNIGSAGVHELQRIERATIRLQTLLRDVLAYTKATHGEIEIKPVALESFLKDLIDDHPELDRSRDAIVIESPLQNVRANEASLAQCLTNLICNALKFVAPETKPRVSIRTEKFGEMVKISVTDNGIGIKPEHRSRIFQMFGRVHGDNLYPGTGIGLTLVKKSAARMGGETGFESEDAKGSTFWFTVPAA